MEENFKKLFGHFVDVQVNSKRSRKRHLYHIMMTKHRKLLISRNKHLKICRLRKLPRKMDNENY